VRGDAINQIFVLGHKVMVGTVNASRDDFVRGVDDLVKAEAMFPGWLARLLTTPVHRARELRGADATADRGRGRGQGLSRGEREARGVKVYDISVPARPGMIVCDSNPGVELERVDSICLPLRLEGSNGAPARAILVQD